MSASVLLVGGLTKPIYKALSGASIQDVYTATQKQERMIMARIVNTTGGAITVTLTYTDTANATDVDFFKGSVPANDKATDDFPIRMLQGDKIKATGNTGITVLLDVLLDNGPLGGLFGGEQ